MIQAFSHQLNPIGTKALKNTTKYSEHIPDVYEATYVLESLLDEFTVQYCGDLDKTLAQTNSYTSRHILDTSAIHLRRLTHKEGRDPRAKWMSVRMLMKALLGKKQTGVMNADVRERVQIYETVDGIRARYRQHQQALHRVVILEVPLINVNTGEIQPDIQTTVISVLDHLGYPHIVYSTGPHSRGVLINLGYPRSYNAAVKLILDICRAINLQAPTYIRLENSSLVTPIPIPLSITHQTHYCCIPGYSAAESISLIASFLAFTKEPIREPLPQTEQDQIPNDEPESIAPEDRHEWRILNDFVVSRTFYTAINKLIGKDKNRDKIRKLLGYLLFSNFKDQEGHVILSSRSLCIFLYGSDKRVEQNNFNLSATLSLLDPFVSITTREHRYKDNRATTLDSATFMEDINVLAANEYKGPRIDLVWLSDGELCRHYEEHKLQEQRQRALDSKLLYPCPIARTLMDTLNSLPSHTFTREYNNHIAEVRDMVELMDGESKENVLWKLKQIKLQPIPIYHQTRNSNRLQPSTSFARLNKELRDTFFQHCYMADLSHCQLAINTMLWDCKEMAEILKTPEPWKRLEEIIGISKADIKALIYPLVYNIYESSKPLPIEEWKLKAFLQSLPVKHLIHARDNYLSDSRTIGFRDDAYGNKVILHRGQENSFLSLISQSYEMYLLADIFKSYIDNKDKNSSKSFQILVYLFDGFIFSCNHRDYERTSTWMKVSVREKCEQRSISTNLRTYRL